jgi:hypothetical protein
MHLLVGDRHHLADERNLSQGLVLGIVERRRVGELLGERIETRALGFAGTRERVRRLGKGDEDKQHDHLQHGRR